MQLFYQPGIPEGVDHLEREESRHCVKVLRKHQYETIDLVDGQGWFYKAQLLNTDPQKTRFEILSKHQEEPLNFEINLAVAPTKRMERMEWLVEKATEIGVNRITFLHCDNSERKDIRLDRLQRKAISAMKQSLKSRLPHIEGMTNFKTFINAEDQGACKYVAHLTDEADHLGKVAPAASSYLVLIGPEGDFSDNELALAKNNHFTEIHLGPARLRTETAALAALISLHIKQDL